MLKRSLKQKSARPVGRRNRNRVHPGLESLENRLQPSTVTPVSLSYGAGSPIATGGSETPTISITLPPASVINKVDVDLLLDDTGSFEEFSSTVQSIFSSLVSSLQSALPSVDFGFGVTRFEDYGGPGDTFSGDVVNARPFILNQPIVNTATAGGTAALESLISTALSHTAPGNGGDIPEADMEALDQIATGAGFDGNADGNTTDSGPAGATNTQVNPGNSGDIPAFSTNTLPASGTEGGVGWRPDALHLVILATDTAPVAAFPAGSPIPATITGAGSSSVPTTAFESTDGRVGFVSNSDSTSGNTVANAVAPAGAATVQGAVSALNSLGIRVIGMGPGSAPTTSTSATLNPSTFMSALGRLTGAVDGSGNPLVFSTSVSTSALTTAIVNAIQTTATVPVNIGLSTTALPAHIGFANSTGVVDDVGPGGTATFNVAISGDGTVPISGSFNINFIDVGSSAILGTIPVTLDIPAPGADNFGLLLLDPTGKDALTVSGNGVVAVNGGSGAVVVNSNNSEAAVVADNGIVTASDIDITGGNSTRGNGSFTGAPIDHETPAPDPIALPLPPPPAQTFSAVNDNSFATLTLSPGTYVGGIHAGFAANIVLLPGVYYLEGGGLQVSGAATIIGNGVLIINAPAGPNDSIKFSGNARVNLSAPAPASLPAGYSAYHGITLFQDPASALPISISDASVLTMDGALYAPTATLAIGQDGMLIDSTDTTTPVAEVIVADADIIQNGVLIINTQPRSS